MNEINPTLRETPSKSNQTKSESNVDEVDSKIEAFKKKKAVMKKIEKLDLEKITLKAKLDRVNSKLAELLTQV